MELRRAGTNWGALMTRALERLDALGARILFAEGRRCSRTCADFVVFLLGHVAAWTLYAWLSHNNLSSSADLTEAYAWGREFEWGYHKHPPLSAWIAAAWFELMPRSDWAYFLLAALIVAIGYAGVWALIGLLEKGPRRLVAVMALEFSPIYGFLAIRFNANSVLLALWPWATWAFLRAVRDPTLLNGALLGLALAAALLAKYYSLVLIIGMLAALLVGENRWRLLTSPAMAGAVAAGALALAPHLVWLVQSDFAPIRYADDQTASSLGQFFGYLIKFPLAQLLYVAPIVAVAALALPRPDRIASPSLFAFAGADDDRRRILALGIVPFLATVALGVVTFSQLSTIWGIPLWFLTGWILLSSPGIAATEVNAPRIAALVVLFWAVAHRDRAGGEYRLDRSSPRARRAAAEGDGARRDIGLARGDRRASAAARRRGRHFRPRDRVLFEGRSILVRRRGARIHAVGRSRPHRARGRRRSLPVAGSPVHRTDPPAARTRSVRTRDHRGEARVVGPPAGPHRAGADAPARTRRTAPLTQANGAPRARLRYCHTSPRWGEVDPSERESG